MQTSTEPQPQPQGGQQAARPSPAPAPAPAPDREPATTTASVSTDGSGYNGYNGYPGNAPVPYAASYGAGYQSGQNGQCGAPRVLHVQPQPARVVYRYTYRERARAVYCGSVLVRLLTLIFLMMLVVGIALEVDSPTQCGAGCTHTRCIDSVWGDDYPCTCQGGTTCENKRFGPEGQAGAALIGVATLGLFVQLLVVCGCCGLCCFDAPVVVQQQPALVIATQYGPPAPIVVQPVADD